MLIQCRPLFGRGAASRRWRLTRVVEIDATMPRSTTSSAGSLPVPWVIGRPDLSGGSPATARIRVIGPGVNWPGAPGRGPSERIASIARRQSAPVSRHSDSVSQVAALIGIQNIKTPKMPKLEVIG
jgi:hypothetical protein